MFIIWDVGACKSKSSRIIRKISDILRSDIALALIYCSNPGELPADLSDLNYSFRTILRFGIECKYDAIVDSTRFIANTKKYTLVVISDEFSLWLYMILINQQIYSTLSQITLLQSQLKLAYCLNVLLFSICPLKILWQMVKNFRELRGIYVIIQEENLHLVIKIK